MKMHFTMVLQGEDIIEQKFKAAIENNPELHMDLIRGIAQLLMMGFNWKHADNIMVESFRCGKVEEPVQPSSPTITEKTDNQEQQELPKNMN